MSHACDAHRLSALYRRSCAAVAGGTCTAIVYKIRSLLRNPVARNGGRDSCARMSYESHFLSFPRIGLDQRGGQTKRGRPLSVEDGLSQIETRNYEPGWGGSLPASSACFPFYASQLWRMVR